MKKIFQLLCLLCVAGQAYSQEQNQIASTTDVETAAAPVTRQIAIIPEPVSLVRNTGVFVLPKKVIIQADKSTSVKPALDYLQLHLSIPTGSFVTAHTDATAETIRFVLNPQANPALGKEGYQLSVTPKLITIKANTGAGLFYGVQSLLQLFPKEIASKELVEGVKWTLPCVEITDYPKLAWRGLMFDVARHFFTKNEVKQYIDAMVKYKYNLLHLHLTDDEGWRLEIKGLPKLTEVGAWRVKKEGNFGDFTPPTPNEPKDYGGFYTQDDIKEIIQYAKDRYVDIMPEIDVPGHSLAAIASYPELSCTPGAEKYQVRSGEKIMDWSRGAPPIALVDNTLCPANEKVYAFLDTVLTQVAALFPFEYIHLGGDEAPINFWQKNDAIKALMQREGMKKIEEVQGYFERRVKTIVESKGKKFIGWDEILEGGLAPNATVMSWRGEKGGIEAAKQKHNVIMTPTTYVYLDYSQTKKEDSVTIGGYIPLKKVYNYEPIPAELNADEHKYVLGAQANLWTEYVKNDRKLEYMIFPRMTALSEVLWSKKELKNWDDFQPRLKTQLKRFDLWNINYSKADWKVEEEAAKTTN